MTKVTQVIQTEMLIVAVLILSACAPLPTPTSSPPPASPVTESSPPPVATTTPNLQSGPITPYPGNPILTLGDPEAWDHGAVFGPRVVLTGGVYHLFYNGSSDSTLTKMAIGYATSSDGRAFTRPIPGPILAGDERGFDGRQVNRGVPVFDGHQWILYYNAGGGPGSVGKSIGRATASDPVGPWERSDQPVLIVGQPGSWDDDYIVPESVLLTDEGYVMYYTGGSRTGSAMIGLATSTDGISWKKRPDPVLRPGSEGSWDAMGVWGCAVLPPENGTDWEMFYTGGGETSVAIGYATSSDGIEWNKYADNPVLSADDDPASSIPILQSPSVIREGSTYVIYYDYGATESGIGVGVGSAISP